MPVIKFTSAFMATGLICPEGKARIEYSLADEPGLFVEVRSAQSAVPTWYLRLKNAKGTNVYRRLGTIKELTLTQARKLAKQMRAEHLMAIKKERTETASASGDMRLETFFEDYYLPNAKLHKRSWKRDIPSYYPRTAARFSNTPLKGITRLAVQQFQNELAQGNLAPASQDHHIKLLRRMLNLAVEWQFLEKNPLNRIRLRMVDNELHDVPDEEQLARLIEVLRTHKNRTVCHILMFLLSTGARRNEAVQATWSQIDLDKKVWSIPAANSKSKRPRTVPLNDSALYVLELSRKDNESNFVFPSPKTGKAYIDITPSWYRIRKLAGITHMRIHSLRHQFASKLVSSGRSLYDVQVLLGHSDPRVSQRYAKLSMQTLQEASNAASILVPNVLPTVPPPNTVQEQAQSNAEQVGAEILQFPKAA